MIIDEKYISLGPLLILSLITPQISKDFIKTDTQGL